MDKRVLGKGLSALIPEKSMSLSESEKGDEITFINTDLVKDNRFQPRQKYDDLALEELQNSIKEKGLLQPLLVRKDTDGYEVVAGERRLRAARALNLERIPVVIRNVSDDEALLLALIENIQRENLNAIEEAKAFRKLATDFQLSQDQIAQSVGKDVSTISNTLRLLKLPEEIQNKVVSGDISMGHARSLVGVEDKILQKKLFELILKKRISVRELENLIRGTAEPPASKRKKVGENSHELLSLEEELQRVLGTKVSIQARRKRGKLVIEYYSLDDLERILKIIRNE